ncbi:hypothetical protein IAU60_002011 [Kwoniella sp. DSM 27419]
MSSGSSSPSPAHTPGMPGLSVLVLMPAEAHWQGMPTPPSRPGLLSHRQSSSNVPTLYTVRAGQEAGGPGPGVAAAATANRRLSLATGLGAGPSSFAPVESTKPRVQPQLSPTATSPARADVTPLPPTSPPLTTASRPPAFGSKRPPVVGSGARGSRRRPQTAGMAVDPLPVMMGANTAGARASLAAPSVGMGGPSKMSRARPGWEADEVVGHLRGNGLEVTVIRHASHLPPLLDPSSSSSFPSQPIARPSEQHETFTRVILVPLSDSPAFPSLSLLLQQGTTPTAVCFQQDLLDRARRSEEEWLPSALDQIYGICAMRDRLKQASGDEPPSRSSNPVVVAYSANPAISSTAISGCLSAGAAGVLRPPYDAQTAKTLASIVEAHQQGRSTAASGAASMMSSRADSPVSGFRSPVEISDELTNVVLPPTSLDMGGEHEGEKVLSAAVSSASRHRKSSSGAWNLDPIIAQRSSISIGSRKGSASSGGLSNHMSPPALSPIASSRASRFDFSPLPQDFPLPAKAPFLASNPALEPRRRSVDVGGLSLALKRASLAFQSHDKGSLSPGQPQGQGAFASALSQIQEGFSFPPPASPSKGNARETAVPGDLPADGSNETALAELLSAMFCHTMTAIDVQMSDYEALSAPLSDEHRDRLIDELSTWNFKPHHLPEGDLYRVACLMFEGILRSEGIADLEIGRDQINRLLFAIRAIYHAPNPYHNYVHAIDVLQATYMFLVQIGVAPPFSYLRDWSEDKPVWKRPENSERELSVGTQRARDVLRPQDVLGILIAAMGHDVGHPGLSNAFMKNAKVPLSQVYEDKSVLENMHCMLIVQLLRKHGFGFLVEGALTPAAKHLDQKSFRRVLYSSVLATDMSLHFAWIQRLKDFGEGMRERIGSEDDEYDRVMICQALIKCADISNPTRPIDVSQHWSSVLLEEWAKQASLEQDLELPVSVVASADAALQAKGQIGFIDLFTLPLFQAASEALPELQVYADSCADNREIWQRRLDELVAEPGEEGDVVRQLIQPAVEGASHDDRFKSLFPLLLPTSLLASPADDDAASLPTPTTPPTPTSASLGMTPGVGLGLDGAHADSPETKAMRAVYRAKLGEPVSRGRVTSSSWARSMGEWNEGRRMSTPEVVVSHGQFR